MSVSLTRARPNLLLVSLSRTVPGIPIGASMTLPLNPDPYLLFSMAYANSFLYTTTLGKLDQQGKASAKFTASSLIPQSLTGARFHHAYLVFGNSRFDFASNAVSLTRLK